MLATLAPEPRPLPWQPAGSAAAVPEIAPADPWRAPAVTLWRDVPIRCHQAPGPVARLRAATRARGHAGARWLAAPWRLVADGAMPTRYRNLRAAAEP